MPVLAEDHSAALDFGGDSFLAGRSVTHDRAGTDDLFMAGETVAGRVEITGSAHLAGREVLMEGAVGGDAYVAGEEITLLGNVSGDVTVAGRAVSVAGVGGDLRIAGSEVQLRGDIGGYAMVAGEEIAFDAAVTGDVSLAARDVDWGEMAAIGGRLFVYEEETGALDVPERVVPADRIERREIEEWEGPERPNLRSAIGKFLFGVIVVAGLAALIAALVPGRLAEMRRQILAQPFKSLWLGFLMQSMLIGAGVLFAMTIIGLLLTPAMLLLVLLGGFAGYVVASYAFGVGLLMAVGTQEPDSIGDRALAAGVGALAAGIIGLIPFLGWLFVLALVLSGIGAITARVVRPVFFSDTV
ncbi:MAG: hypothetical protein HKP40_08160 [Litoreibacter sp.]|nr:hypothetical protein [Litoreibacter sp.]